MLVGVRVVVDVSEVMIIGRQLVLADRVWGCSVWGWGVVVGGSGEMFPQASVCCRRAFLMV